jgi:predicted metalloprotease with PDZ domain
MGVGLLTVDGWVTTSTAAEPIVYTLRFPEAQNHYVEIEARFPGSDRPETELMMAVWTPGSYLVREYARHIESMNAVDENQKSLPLVKTKKNRWVVQSPLNQPIFVRYRVYCRELTVRTNWVGHEYAMLNGAPTFVTLADGQSLPHHVKIELPSHWRQSVTSLARLDDGTPHHYVADNYDQLVDSPIVCGNPDIYRFRVGGREHLLVNQGGGDVWDGAKSAEHVAKIVREHQRMWGVVPYKKYTFFNMIVQSRGGLEHDNSTLMLTNRWHFRERKDYLRWLSLVSHEFFHTWNIRRLRPIPLLEYDYESENYTHSLWIAEGITSYYDDLTLARCGLSTQTEYLAMLSKNIETLQAVPGRKVQSLRASSHDTWIKFYRPDENSNNTRVSYYTKGAVVAFLLDAKIRQASNGNKTLDDVMRQMYQTFSGQRGYTPTQFRAVASQVAGANLNAWFAGAIDRTGELDYEPALAWYGLQFKPEAAKPDVKKDAAEKTTKNWLGITTRTDDGRIMVSRVERDSPAYRAGVNVDDEILAINDFRVRPDKWSARLKQYKIGEEIRLLVSRAEQLKTIGVTLQESPRTNWKLVPLAKPTDQQKQRLARWLHAE